MLGYVEMHTWRLFTFVCIFHERNLNIVNEEDAAMANPEAQFEGSETKGRKESSMQEDWGILARRLLGSAIDASNQWKKMFILHNF